VVCLRGGGRNRYRCRLWRAALLLLPAACRRPRWDSAWLLILGLQHRIGVHHVYISILCIGKKWMELAARHLIFLLLSIAVSQRNFILYSQLLFVGNRNRLSEHELMVNCSRQTARLKERSRQ
jgi:hypothetical protein